MADDVDKSKTPFARLVKLTYGLTQIVHYLQDWRNFHRDGVFRIFPTTEKPGWPHPADMSPLAFEGRWQLPEKYRTPFYRPVAHAVGNFRELGNRIADVEDNLSDAVEYLSPSRGEEARATMRTLNLILDYEIQGDVWLIVQDEKLNPRERRRRSVNRVRDTVKTANSICGPMLYRAAGFVDVAADDVVDDSGSDFSHLDPGDIERVREYLKTQGSNPTITALRRAVGIRNQTASDILKYLKNLGEYSPD